MCCEPTLHATTKGTHVTLCRSVVPADSVLEPINHTGCEARECRSGSNTREPVFHFACPGGHVRLDRGISATNLVFEAAYDIAADFLEMFNNTLSVLTLREPLNDLACPFLNLACNLTELIESL